MRGVAGSTRATRFGRVKDYAKRVQEEICVLVQVETKGALDQLEDICAVDGVDGVFIGPADLHASMGYTGEINNPAVVPMIEEAMRRIRKCGKAPGVLAFAEPDIRRYIAAGALFTAVGVGCGHPRPRRRGALRQVQGLSAGGEKPYAAERGTCPAHPSGSSMAEDTEKVEIHRGLQGVHFDRSRVCFIDGRAGELLYRGYSIHDLADALDVRGNLLPAAHGELPTRAELERFDAELKAARALPAGILDIIRTVRAAHPMDVLRTAVSALAAFDPDVGDNSRAGDARGRACGSRRRCR